VEIYKERNTKIINMKKNGKTNREISEIFDISPNRVYQIIKKDEKSIKNNWRIQKVIKNIKLKNNLKKKWPKEEIVDCLQLSKVATKAIGNYFEKRNILEVSLIDIMDLCVNKNIKDYMDLSEAIPVCRLKNVGRKTLIHIINKLSVCNFGVNYEGEWINRKIKLKTYLKINKFIYLEKRINY